MVLFLFNPVFTPKKRGGNCFYTKKKVVNCFLHQKEGGNNCEIIERNELMK